MVHSPSKKSRNEVERNMGKKGKWSKQSKKKDTLHPKSNNSSNDKSLGFLDPSALARHAALARQSQPQPVAASHDKNQTKSQNGQKKRKRPGDVDQMKENPKKQVTLNTSITTANTVKKRKKAKATNSSLVQKATKDDLSTVTSNQIEEKKDSVSVIRFGYPKWRNIEQLCHIFLFHHTYLNLQQLFPRDVGNVTSAGIVVAFMTHLEQVKEYASLFKPVVHPYTSSVCHKKVNQVIFDHFLQHANIIKSYSKTRPSKFQHHFTSYYR